MRSIADGMAIDIVKIHIRAMEFIILTGTYIYMETILKVQKVHAAMHPPIQRVLAAMLPLRTGGARFHDGINNNNNV